MNNNHNNSIRQSVLEKIKSGKVRRLPHAYFIARILATIGVGLLLLLVSAFIFSFLLFSLHESGEHALLGFGPSGIVTFFILFPWPLVLIDVGLLFLLEWLLQGFKFGYRIPLLNVFIGIFTISTIAGFLINATPLHTYLLHKADNNQLPVVGGAYEHIFDHHDIDGVGRGLVVSTTTDGFVIQHNDHDHDTDDSSIVVAPAPGVVLPIVKPGDRVIIFGQPQADGVIYAQNAQILDPLDLPSSPPEQ
jgi:hypothetical protein